MEVDGTSSFSNFPIGIGSEYVPKFTPVQPWTELNLNLFEIFQNPTTTIITNESKNESPTSSDPKSEISHRITIFDLEKEENSPNINFQDSPNLPDSPNEDLDSEGSDTTAKTIGRTFSLFTKQKTSDLNLQTNQSSTNLFENIRNKLNIKKELLSVKRESPASLSTRFRKGTFFQRGKYVDVEEKKKK